MGSYGELRQQGGLLVLRWTFPSLAAVYMTVPEELLLGDDGGDYQR